MPIDLISIRILCDYIGYKYLWHTQEMGKYRQQGGDTHHREYCGEIEYLSAIRFHYRGIWRQVTTVLQRWFWIFYPIRKSISLPWIIASKQLALCREGGRTAWHYKGDWSARVKIGDARPGIFKSNAFCPATSPDEQL